MFKEYEKHLTGVFCRLQEASPIFPAGSKSMMKFKKYRETSVIAVRFDGDKKISKSPVIKEHIMIP